LPDSRLEDMQRGAQLCVAALHVLASKGLNTITAVLGGHGALVEWQHYPGDKDVFDPRSGSQYYFHSHAKNGKASAEHGHFHLFGRAAHSGMQAARKEQPCTHLLGISVNAQGLPVRLFTTNRWVTDEQWLSGCQVLELIDSFSIGKRQPSQALHQWLRGMLLLFRPQIEGLIAQRDAWLQRAVNDRPLEKVLEDRRIHIISSTKAAFFEQVQAMDELD